VKGGLKLAEYKEIKKRLIDGDHTLKWLWRKVRVRGFASLAYNRFCEVMNGSYIGGYAPAILDTAEQVLDEEDKKPA